MERDRKREKVRGREKGGGGEESERCPQHYGTQSMESHRLKR